MLARQPVSAIPQQVFGHAPAVLGDALLENVNLSVGSANCRLISPASHRV